MARVVLDTTVVIDHLRDATLTQAWFATLSDAPFCSEVTRVEVMQGLRSHERSVAENFLAGVDWVPVSEPIARLAGELGRRYRRSHSGISVVNLIVAATAVHLGAELATANVRHYPMFPRLRPPY
jgi:predicted nucleic acid-binding protein